MYQEIQQLKEVGLNKSQVQRKLKIDWKTVDKYWELTPDQFAAAIESSKRRTRYLELYEDRILQWLRKHADLSAAQVQDWLKEHYQDYTGSERTVRRYLSQLRQEHGLVKPVKQRQYQAVQDPPHGVPSTGRFGSDQAAGSPGARGNPFGFWLRPLSQPVQVCRVDR